MRKLTEPVGVPTVDVTEDVNHVLD